MNTLKFKVTRLFKHIVICILLLFKATMFGQAIGVNTKNALGIFHVDGKGDNNITSAPTQAQQANDFIITKEGNVGIGLINPLYKLHINSEADPIKVEGISIGDINTDGLLLLDENNIVKKIPTLSNLAIPMPAVFTLENNLDIVYPDKDEAKIIPMKMIVNSIKGLTFDEETSTINFPKGIYKISFNYEGFQIFCTQSTHSVIFPSTKIPEGVRITKASPHGLLNTTGSYGETITYVTTLSKPQSWQIRLNDGRTGLCDGLKTLLKKDSTQLIINRLGD